MDLSQYDYQGLRDLKDQVEREMKVRERSEREAAARQIKEIADRVGASVEELLGMAGKGKAPKPAKNVKFRDPNDSSRTWSGRGRKPRWIEDALREGRNLDEFLA